MLLNQDLKATGQNFNFMKKQILFFALFILILPLGYLYSTTLNQAEHIKFDEVVSLINQHYPSQISVRGNLKKNVSELLKSLDSYSEYLSAREFYEIKSEVLGKYEGVGVVLEIENYFPFVKRVIPNSPAQKADIKAGDVIEFVDEVSTHQRPLREVLKLIRGSIHTEVLLKISRDGSEAISVLIQRDKVKVTSIHGARLLNSEVGYLAISEFTSMTPSDLVSQIGSFLNKGVKYFIIDLRHNSGGELDSVVRVCDLFLPENKILVQIEGSDFQVTEKIFSTKLKIEEEFNFVLLVDSKTASSAELMAACLQDHERAWIIGEKTFGKGSVQTVFPLSDGSAVKLTTAYYLTPLGKSIEGIGVTPNLALNLSKEIEIAETIKDDVFIKAALEYLNA